MSAQLSKVRAGDDDRSAVKTFLHDKEKKILHVLGGLNVTRVGAVAADVAAHVTESTDQRSRSFDKMCLYVFCISVKIDKLIRPISPLL